MNEFSPTMNRSVAQLLYSYLPEKTVDWENGITVVVLGSPRLQSVWPSERSVLVREELAAYLERWRARGGRAHDFPDPVDRPREFVLGTPTMISAKVLSSALVCRECSGLVFRRRRYLANRKAGRRRLRCPQCKKETLRQFGLVFVHGCGVLLSIRKELPMLKNDGTQIGRAHV